jgi:hypothetical protein
MGIHVMAVYRPKTGREAELDEEVRQHVAILRRLDLATDSSSLILRAADGTIVECFEWASRDAIDAAHSHPEVPSMWDRFGACCDYGTLAELPNASDMFAEFEHVGFY